VLIKEIKKDWNCLINLDETKKVIGIQGKHLIRKPLPDEHLLCGRGHSDVIAVYYSIDLKNE
jgi:hypothetical protein